MAICLVQKCLHTQKLLRSMSIITSGHLYCVVWVRSLKCQSVHVAVSMSVSVNRGRGTNELVSKEQTWRQE
jgi:hypothetical protein